MAGESSNCLASAPVAINERVIADKVLGVRRGHLKGVGRIIKGKRKAPDTSYSTTAFGLEQCQVVEEHRRLAERVNAQQRDIEPQHHEINVFKVFITQTLSQAQPPPPPLPLPSPPPPPLPPSDDAEDLRRN